MQKRRPSHTHTRKNKPGSADQDSAFHSPFGTVELHRFPKENDPNLRAWSAADELLLSHFKDELLPTLSHPPKILIANDTFGAVSICTAELNPTLWSDSFICQQALNSNILVNSEHLKNDSHIHFLPSTNSPKQTIDVALISLPKNHQYLRFQLEQIRSMLAPNGIVIASVMVKHFHHNALKYFEECIGDTHTSLAVKKARLIIAHHTNPTQTLQSQKTLSEYANSYPLDDTEVVLKTLPNVFSWDKLDIGTRALLPCIPSSSSIKHVLDLGCGNGALGIQAALNNPQAKITFCDESYLAIESARLSVASSGIKNHCQFIVTDSLKSAPNDIDLILCNPPFHQQNSIHTEIAARMFQESHQHLVANGQLLVVANRHLKYQAPLSKKFKHVVRVLDNNKFVVISAQK